MAREVPEIDRLIEEGLTLYGQGDLDGALARWERALVIDPDNPQANSYVDYVRANYELLTSDINGEATTEGPPFGITEDESEYQIEIQPGEIKPSVPTRDAPVSLDPLDEGWFLDQETQSSKRYDGGDGRPSQEMTVELEADEPPEPYPTGTREPLPPTFELEPPGVSFEDATREYPPTRRGVERAVSDPYGSFAPQPTPAPPPPMAGTSDDFGPEATPGFGHPNDFQTPPGFGTQITGIKQRDDLGFVKPAPASATALGLPNPRAPAKASAPPANEPSEPSIELSLEPLEPADAPTTERRPISAADLDDMDLISSLPSPRPAQKIPQIAIETPLSGSKPSGSTTRDFPVETRAPAFSSARTREMAPADVKPAVSATQTGDFDAKTTERPPLDPSNKVTRDIPNMGQVAKHPDPIISAPTRDLGLRDLPAKQPRAESASREGTRADAVLAFDPIDARSAEIMDEVDAEAPRDEAKEDQTRRRITTLFERAAQWSSEGDLERAVAAVDLALSEEPSAALAQKLIHRNRDTIMNVFQTYLGDLERTPQLAKPLHELANAPISSRAAFLLSRIDGSISIDEILDVCGMPRLEAYRYLCQLFLRGILR